MCIIQICFQLKQILVPIALMYKYKIIYNASAQALIHANKEEIDKNKVFVKNWSFPSATT